MHEQEYMPCMQLTLFLSWRIMCIVESDTVVDFVPITAPLPSVSYRSHYRSRDIIPVTVTVPVVLSLLPYFYYRSRFRVQFDESDVC